MKISNPVYRIYRQIKFKSLEDCEKFDGICRTSQTNFTEGINRLVADAVKKGKLPEVAE